MNNVIHTTSITGKRRAHIIYITNIHTLHPVTQSDNQTALHFAVRHRHSDIARLLVESGCDINASERMTHDVTTGTSINNNDVG